MLITTSSSRLINFLACCFSVRSLFKCHFPAAEFDSQHFKLNVLVHDQVSRSFLSHFTRAHVEVELPVYLERGSRVKVASSYASYRKKKKRKAVSKMKSHHFFLSSGLAKTPSNRFCSCSHVQLQSPGSPSLLNCPRAADFRRYLYPSGDLHRFLSTPF